MAGKTREIKGRIRAVGNIQRITRTMQMIATARFQSMQKRATSAQIYTRHIAQLVGELADAVAADGSFRHPLLSLPEPAVGRKLLLTISSNRGLAGAYNANVLRTARNFLREQQGGVELEVVGRKAVNYFKFNHIAISEFHSEFGDKPEYDDVDRLAQKYIEAFAAGKYDSVHVAYTAFESMSRQAPKVIQLLPLQNPAAHAPGKGSAAAATQYDFTPDAQTLLDELLPITVKTRLFQCFNEAVVSEQLARMVGMKSATDAAAKMKKSLQRQFNRARQTAITTELTEIIGGSAALS